MHLLTNRFSYCWGDPEDLEEVLCSRQTVDITYSLYSGLERFRYPQKVRILWADAICINQANDKEKGVQVNMMGEIYDRATGILVWLGDAPILEVEKAFRLLRAINEYIDSQIVEIELVDNPWKAVANVPVLIDRKRVFHDPSESDALKLFWLAPWFGRVWVLQEVAFASTALVFYGAASINLSEVIQAAYLLGWRSDLNEDFPVGRWADAFGDTLVTYTTKKTWIQEKRLLRAWQESLTQEESLTLNKILISSSRFEATNPLDHIYAFLGHPAAKAKDGSCILEADYTISIDNACQRLAQSLYERDQQLNFLCTISHFTLADIEEFPSWIPKVHKAKLAHNNDHRDWNADYSATTDFPKAIFRENMLHCWALIFDSIGVCSETFRWGVFEITNPTTVERCWNLYAECTPQVDVEKQSQAFMRTLVGGVYTGGSVHLQRDFGAYCRANTSSQFCSALRLENVETERSSLIDGNRMHFKTAGYMSMNGRRFFITKGGRFGLGPSFLQHGDICCVLLGCKKPLVLRPMSTNGHFKVLGSTYIDGAMFGEMIVAYGHTIDDLRRITLV